MTNGPILWIFSESTKSKKKFNTTPRFWQVALSVKIGCGKSPKTPAICISTLPSTSIELPQNGWFVDGFFFLAVMFPGGGLDIHIHRFPGWRYPLESAMAELGKESGWLFLSHATVPWSWSYCDAAKWKGNGALKRGWFMIGFHEWIIYFQATC